MYVPAKTTSNNKLLLAIGTGYYTEKNATEAGEFFDCKLKFLKARSQELEALIRQKQAQAKQLMCVPAKGQGAGRAKQQVGRKLIVTGDRRFIRAAH